VLDTVIRRRVRLGGIVRRRRRRRHGDGKAAELPLIAAVSVTRRAGPDGQQLDDTTADESDCTTTVGDSLRLFYDCKRPIHCSYQVSRQS